MKKLITLAILALLWSCKGTDEPTVKKFVIDPMATVNIKPAAGTVLKVKGENNPAHLTALEIVKKATALRYYYNDPNLSQGYVLFGRGFDVLQRDTISTTPALKMWATDIIRTDFSLIYDFIESKDCYLEAYDKNTKVTDTIAYIPNTVLRNAETQIKTLYTAKNYETIIKLFNDAYTFIPISGAEYKALKAQGLQ